MNIGKNAQVLVILLVLAILFEGSFAGLRLLSTSPSSYVSGYEGVKARYAGVQYGGSDHKSSLWGSTFRWDADQARKGLPAIAGEMTTVFVPQESVGTQPRWIPSEWLLGATQIRNPVTTYEWELPVEGTGETAFYRMEEWQLKWYFSISCEPTGEEYPDFAPIPDPTHLRLQNRLTNVNVWFRFDLNPTWYFQNATSAYFAIAKIQVSEIAFGRIKESGEYEDEKNDRMRVDPSSPYSPITIFYGIFGSQANRAEKDAYSYKGKMLNPDLFTDHVYGYFTLEDFGVSSWWAMGAHHRADAVTVACNVHVFVIGEWKVKDIQEIPDEYGRESKTFGTNVLAPFGEWFASPEGRLLSLLIVGTAILIFLAIVAPSFLLGLIAILRGGRR